MEQIYPKKANILLVDDEPLVRRVLFRRLSKEGYNCQEVGSGDEALAFLDQAAIDLVIMDIRMPGKTGAETLPMIRRKFPFVAVIMSTAVSEINTVIQCMKEGAKDYITKPFNLEDVVTSIGKALEMSKIEQQLKDHQESLEQKLELQKDEIRKRFLESIESIIFTLESKDKYNTGHSQRVTSMALKIGEELSLSRQELEDLRWGALLHDLGKIAIDSAIQNKPDQLTEAEYNHILAYVQIGPDIIKSVANENVLDIVRYHHARFDGNGAEGKKGKEIPLGARIVAVGDSYDSMISSRPYRKALSPAEALNEISRSAGGQLDPELVEIFKKIMTMVET
jgi:response regulator RpfG family c-di-GMP phosphodiesterase